MIASLAIQEAKKTQQLLLSWIHISGGRLRVSQSRFKTKQNKLRLQDPSEEKTSLFRMMHLRFSGEGEHPLRGWESLVV